MEEMKSTMATEEAAAMDEYMKKSDYAADGSMVKLASVAKLAEDATNAFKLGGKNALDFAQKTDLENVQKTAINAQTSALQAQETANKALDKADGALGVGSEARIVAGDAYTKADQAKRTAEAAQVGLAGKVDTIDGKELSANDYTNEEKAKLAGIEAEANKYVHPQSHPAGMIDGLPDVVQEAGMSVTDVMSQKAVTDELNKKGNGDMLKSVYDKNNNGVVDDAEKLGEQLPAYYAKEAEVFKKTGGTINGNVTVTGNLQGISLGIYSTDVAFVYNPVNKMMSLINADGIQVASYMISNGSRIESDGNNMKLVATNGVSSKNTANQYSPFFASSFELPDNGCRMGQYKYEVGLFSQGGVHSLTRDGSGHYPYYGSAFTQVSSKSGKENIVPYTGALEKLNIAKIYSYDKKADGMKQIGMVIEDETTPEEVIVDGVQNKRTKSTNDGEQYIDLYSFISMTAQAVKELKADKDTEIAALKALLVSKGVCTQEEIDNF